MNWQNDETYMRALCEGNSKVLDEIYRRFGPQIRGWVCQNNGDADDAADLMQDSLIAIYDRYCGTEFTFSGTFGGLLTTIARRIWYDKLARKKRDQDVRKEDLYGHEVEVPEVEAAEEALLAKQRMDVLQEVFLQLSEQCQRLLSMFAEGVDDPEVIASQLGIPTVNAVYQAKHRCLNRWKQLFQERFKH